MTNNKIDKGYKDYIEAGEWRCVDSPTGAHHWFERHAGSNLFFCKYCYKARRMGPEPEPQKE